MLSRAIPQSTPTVIQQRVATTRLFTGVLPPDNATPDASNALYKYAELDANGCGLFLWRTREPIVVSQFLIDLNGSANVTVDVVNIDPTTIDADVPTVLTGETVTIATATAVAFLMLNETNFRATLLPFQALRLVTTASGAAQIAQCTAYLDRSRQW